jgi:hypothetical protein
MGYPTLWGWRGGWDLPFPPIQLGLEELRVQQHQSRKTPNRQTGPNNNKLFWSSILPPLGLFLGTSNEEKTHLLLCILLLHISQSLCVMMEVDNYTKLRNREQLFPTKLCMTMESGQSTSLSRHNTLGGWINHWEGHIYIQTSKADASIHKHSMFACLYRLGPSNDLFSPKYDCCEYLYYFSINLKLFCILSNFWKIIHYLCWNFNCK